MTPAIVVAAYNRPAALARLLQSLTEACYPEGDVRLVISIDAGGGGGGAATVNTAAGFAWAHGAKEVIEQARHLGVAAHWLACGELTRALGDIIFLEDDLSVSDSFYRYAAAALEAYRHETRVGCVSLYGLWFNGYTREPFVPIADGGDVFFVGVPYTQGLAFTAGQWDRFHGWLMARGESPVRQHPRLHPAFLSFGRDEWFPWLAAYSAEEERYTVYPRESVVTGWGDAGAHFARGSAAFQTPLARQHGPYALPALDDALAVYDGFFEILAARLRRLNPSLPAEPFSVDLYATKGRASIDTPLVVTSRPARAAVASFGKALWPMEENVAKGVPGNAILLAAAADIDWGWRGTAAARRSNAAFFARGRRASRRRAALDAAASLLLRLGHGRRRPEVKG